LMLTLVGDAPDGHYDVRVFDLLGRQIRAARAEMRSDGHALHGTLSLDPLPSGTYVVELQFHEKHFSTRFTVVR